jgi:hypothetical protein
MPKQLLQVKKTWVFVSAILKQALQLGKTEVSTQLLMAGRGKRGPLSNEVGGGVLTHCATHMGNFPPTPAQSYQSNPEL